MTTASAPTMPAPRSATEPPKSTWRLPAPCWGSINVVSPANVTPKAGVMCHSAAARRGAASTHSPASASVRSVREADLYRKAEEQRGEERSRDVSSRQLERRAQAVAVGQEDERQVTRRHFQHER